jgi:hypothetical protein
MSRFALIIFSACILAEEKIHGWAMKAAQFAKGVIVFSKIDVNMPLASIIRIKIQSQ